MERLSEIDKQKIFDYITYAVNQPEVTIEQILAPWAKAKSQYLNSLFGDNLIIKDTITYTEGYEEVSNKLEDMLYGDKRCNIFRQAILNTYYEKYFEPNNYFSDNRQHYYFVRDTLLSPHTLYNNAISLNHSYELPIGDKMFKIQDGTKPMRVIGKIAQEYNIGMTPDIDGVTDFEYFRRQHSLQLNTKTLSGELCLSIHPLDYMTMSDNSLDWQSCMNWLNNGEYRQGTVEMMNSPCVVVAYLSSKHSFYWNEREKEETRWNNKKWRALFVVDKDFIASVKAYPYENDNLLQVAMRKLAKLSGWGEDCDPVKYEWFNWEKHRKDKIPCKINGVDVAIDFRTEAMYNDFGTCAHYIILNPSYKEDSLINYNYNYSGPAECMICGTTGPDIGKYVGEDRLECEICNPCLIECEWCGERIYIEDSYTTGDDRTVCYTCWLDECSEDALDGLMYMDDSLSELTLLPEEDTDTRHADTFDTIKVYKYNFDTNLWHKYFNIPEPHRSKQYYDEYYIYPSECTALGLELFDIYTEDQLKEFYIRKEI